MTRLPAAGPDARAGSSDADALRAGDEERFTELVQRWHAPMLRLALARVGSRAVAEEVVQEAWLTVLRDLDRFEGRSSLRTWVLGIVRNLARARARAERRALPMPLDETGPVVSPSRFRAPDAREWPDHWRLGPVAWPAPEEAVLAGEVCQVMLRAVAGLPPAQREVLVLRDLEGFSGAETCAALGLSNGNQRVLLHRARSRVRGEIERYFDATEPT